MARRPGNWQGRPLPSWTQAPVTVARALNLVTGESRRSGARVAERPFNAHIVVGDEAIGGRAGEDAVARLKGMGEGRLATWTISADPADKLFEPRPSRRITEIEDGTAVDAVGLERVPPSRRVDADRPITHDHAIVVPDRGGENRG